jgi:signal transduction histidine kinase
MRKRTRIRLTFIYSVLTLSVFWFLSAALYFWFRGSLGDGYITQVQQLHTPAPGETTFLSIHGPVLAIAGKLALNELRTILLILNGGLLLLIPAASWYLTGMTLDPVYRAYEQQKQFVSDASHEMRTPLSILSGEMEITLKKNRTATEYQQILSRSKEEIDRLKSLVENLLFFARDDHTLMERSLMQHIDVTDLINTIISEYHQKLTQKQLTVDFRPGSDPMVVYGSQSMIRTLFANLIDNAIKYSPDKGRIWITLTTTGNYATINIKDNGMGITANEQKHIFDRFYRADMSRSKPKGFGLGLAITKSIVEMHQGSITLKSAPNKGTSFTVSLPVT